MQIDSVMRTVLIVNGFFSSFALMSINRQIDGMVLSHMRLDTLKTHA